jgi:hypothetical protein
MLSITLKEECDMNPNLKCCLCGRMLSYIGQEKGYPIYICDICDNKEIRIEALPEYEIDIKKKRKK